jgi:hypothetical protein
MTMTKSLFDLMNEETPADKAKREADLAKYDSPEEVAKREAKRKEEFERGVRLGWHDENGNPIDVEDDDEEDEEADEE